MKSKIISLEDLLNINLPDKTETYTPISNGVIHDIIVRESSNNDITINKHQFITNAKRNKFIGRYIFDTPDSNLKMELMFKNSYDKSISFGLAAGLNVFVCTNGMVSGELSYKRKHTGDADINVIDYVKFSMDELVNNYELLKISIVKFQNLKLDTNNTKLLLGDLIINDYVNSEQSNIIKSELINSTNFKHYDDDDFTAWDFYNAVTESYKTSNPRNFINNHVNFHHFMENI